MRRSAFLALLVFACPFVWQSPAFGLTYCTASGQNTTYEHIKSVQLGEGINESGAARYTDYTGILLSEVNRGASATVVLTPGFPGTAYRENWKVAIDFNQNGVFEDPGEVVVQQTSASAVIASFNVPASAAIGETRMRVLMNFGTSPAVCGSFTYGEVEDYRIAISPENAASYLKLESDPAHWVGQGVRRTFSAADGAFTAAPNYRNDPKTGIRLSFQAPAGTYYSLSFDAPGDALLQAGQYANAARFPFNPAAQPGLDVATNGRGCNQVKGSFNVFEVSYAPDGSFQSFGAEFVHYCDTDVNGPKLQGTIAYNIASPPQLAYCAAGSKSASSEWIASVKIGDYTKTSTAKAAYEDFTEAATGVTVKVKSGSSIPLVLTPGFSGGPYAENWAVWLDANNDGDFTDAGEQLYAAPVKTSAAISPSVVIPQTLTAKTRLRIRMWWEQTAPNPCGNSYYGQVEDYTVEPAPSGQTLLFDFEEFKNPGTYITTGTYVKNGFVFDTSAPWANKWRIHGPGDGISYAGSAAFESVWAPVTLSLRRADGQAFNLVSMDLTKFWDAPYPANVFLTFTGTRANGTTVRQAITVNHFPFKKYAFAEFTDVVRVEWKYTGSPVEDYHQFDNVVVQIK